MEDFISNGTLGTSIGNNGEGVLKVIKKPLEKNHTAERASLELKYHSFLEENFRLRGLVSYVGNKKEPILRWFRYKESFSVGLVKYLISYFSLTRDDVVLDPFCGMGTTPFTCKYKGIKSIGIDFLPLAAFVSKVLTNLEDIDIDKTKEKFSEIEKYFQDEKPDKSIIPDIPIVAKAFSTGILEELSRWKKAIQKMEYPYSDFFLLLLLSTLEEVSYTSKDGQFLRLVKDKEIPEVREALKNKLCMALEDLIRMRKLREYSNIEVPKIYEGDSRKLAELKFNNRPTALITSPPYLNRYDYSRSYALELALAFVKSPEALIELRKKLLRSHIESKVGKEEVPPHPAIKEILTALSLKKLNNPNIPKMILGYFRDMNKVIRQSSLVLEDGAKLAIVVGNVRFAGELVPVDLILSDMASKHGFKTEKVIITRYKGNSSQQMKKYGRVRVRESILIWSKKTPKKSQEKFTSQEQPTFIENTSERSRK